MPIRQLPSVVVNRIAAGEVIERPAAAVKELVENAIDAGATRIDITVREGGKALLAVADNGEGMSRDELALAVERHCTSKLPDDDLLEIRMLGFRGEALPSIGAVSRLRIVSRPPHGPEEAESAWEIIVEAGVKGAPAPAAHPPGTRVEVRDLFFATPARLKFLKTVRSERDQAVDTVRRLAMACPGIAFTVLGDDERVLLRLPAAASREARLAALLGRDFADNAVPVTAARDGAVVRGLIVGALRHALAEAGQRSSTTVGAAALAAWRPEPETAPRLALSPGWPSARLPPGLAEAGNAFLAPHSDTAAIDADP